MNQFTQEEWNLIIGLGLAAAGVLVGYYGKPSKPQPKLSDFIAQAFIAKMKTAMKKETKQVEKSVYIKHLTEAYSKLASSEELENFDKFQ